MKEFFRMVLPSLLLALGQSANLSASDLDGASGRLFKPDLLERSFEFLTETEYDPKTDIGQSRFTVYWSEDVEVVQKSELQDFSSIPDAVTANFRGIDQANADALRSGEPFTARVATLFEGLEAEPVKDKRPGRAVSGRFLPDPGASRSGRVEVDGKPVKVSLRERHWRIFHHKRIPVEDLTEGFWSVTVHGAEDDAGRFIADRLEVEALPDPRLSDDPELPRVLVIGDSISMNYHDAAKAALAGTANYHRIEGNGFSVIHGVNNAALWLGNYQEPGFHWDVICFNHGLHDLKQNYDPETDRFGAYAVPLEAYKKNLEKLIGILKETGAQLVWTSTTPIPNHNKGKYARRKGAAKLYNEAAMEVVARHPGIIVNDLYQVVEQSPVYDNWRKGTDVHFYKEAERALLGEAVASAVRQALARRTVFPQRLPLPADLFRVAGRPAFLMRPDDAAAERPQPWVWYAPTLEGYPSGEERWMFKQFLEAGIAVAGINVGESMGNPEGRRLFNAFYTELTRNRGLTGQPVLLARSRGGLMLYNWAAENPGKVAAIAGIYPVGNMASWPGLNQAAKAYGISVEALKADLHKHNPVDRLKPLAQAKVPILHLHGDKDKVVPLEENSGLLRERYQDLGGTMQLIVIPDGGHDLQAHWFRNQDLVDYVIKRAQAKDH